MRTIENGRSWSYNSANMQQHIRIASPCSANWNEMIGDDRVRYCPECRLTVYNFSAMTSREVKRIIAQREGRLCARFYQRPDETILTKNCPLGLRAAFWRASRVASAVLAAVISARGVAAQSGSQPSDSSLAQIEQRQRGVELKVLDEAGAAIANAEVTLTNEASGEATVARTSSFGGISLSDLPAGAYGITVVARGFSTLTRAHLPVPSRDTITLKIGYIANMGVVVLTGYTNDDNMEHPPLEQVVPPTPVEQSTRHHSRIGSFFSRLRHIV